MTLLPAFAFFLAVMGALFASMGLFVWLGPKGNDADQKSKGGQLFLGAGDFLLNWFMWIITPLTDFSMRVGLTPDFYNYVGLALGLASGVFIAFGRLELGGWAIALSGVADILDGRIARETRIASDFGDFIDSTFDRFVEVAVFLGFAIFLREHRLGTLLAGLAMGGSLLVSYARARGEALNVLCTGGLMQRGERLVLTSLICLADAGLSAWLGWQRGTAVLWVLALIAATTFVTAVHRTIWIAARLR